MKNKVFTFKLSKKHREKLDEIAKKEGRSKGGWLCRVIEEYPNTKEKNNNSRQECLTAG